MTRTERIQWQIFILLIVALIVSIYYFSGPHNDIPAGPNARKNPALSTADNEDSLPELSMLQQPPPEFNNVKRNVFKFGDGSTDAEDQTSIIEAEPLVPAETEPATPMGPDVTYLGFYHEHEGTQRKLGAISNGGQIYVGSEGEILGGKYKVLRLEDEYIDLEYLPEHRIIHLKLGRNGNAPPSS